MSIELKNVNFIYNEGAAFEGVALKNINLEIKKHEFIGIIGHTGSGKSTMVQLFNGLLRANEGDVFVDGEKIDFTNKNMLRKIRQEVGLVFQYPEYQLFEETISKDIAFGPKNLGLDDKQVKDRVKEAMEMVGLDYDLMKDQSPFDLSGGQKRRVAIASILAMKPRYLILDEPTAGLDPRGRDEILEEIRKIYDRDDDLTIVLVSHSMEDIARLVNRVIVMDKGQVFNDGSPREVYSKPEELEAIGLDVPQITKAMKQLKLKGYDLEKTVLTVEEAYNLIMARLGGDKNE